MKRSIYEQLLIWKKSLRRKPLMMYGARQVGKTYILKEFGSREFDNMVYINCYKNPAVEALFSVDKDVDRIILGLSALSGEEIKPGRTLIFLDEVQDIPAVVGSLKYFCEDAQDFYIVVAGSLLGVLNMEGQSFPTGKVDILHLYPMTFIEFLYALGEDKKALLLENPDKRDTVNDILPAYIELLRQYYFVGGMPEAVMDFVENKTPKTVRQIQQNILSAYEADIAKHAGRQATLARLIFQSIPSQLAKENKRFMFSVLKKGSRASDYSESIQWLADAGLIYKVCRLSKVAVPLKFYQNENVFKLYLLDVGLLGAMAQVPPALMLIGDKIFSEYKGAFTENYVLSQMVCVPDVVIDYYSKENSTMEIDFVAQCGTCVMPIEVKAEENVKAKSLRQFVTVDNAGSGMIGYRFSMKGFVTQGWMDNVPLIAVTPFISQMSLS